MLIVAVAAAAATATWLIVRGGGSSAPTAASTTTTATGPVSSLGPVAASHSALVAFSAALQRPIYWMGPVKDDTYEFTEASSGDLYVRYLPKGVRVGDPRATFPVIATYPYRGALAALRAVAKDKGQRLLGGGFMLANAAYPKSVYIAYPGVAYQIEVYDPVTGRARTIALSGRVRAVS
jgi:hypothetical protein